MTEESWFGYNGQNSKRLAILITEPPDETLPERDVETVPVPGRSGDLTIDGGRWLNVTRSYKCYVLPDAAGGYRAAYTQLAAWLRPSAAYERLEDSFCPELFRLARALGDISLSSIMEQAGEFTAKFDCKPQRYLKSGETAVTFTAAGTLQNQTGFAAQPLIYVYGDGAGSITVGTQTVTISSMPASPLIIDCEEMDAYSVSAAGATTNRNATISAATFPTLEAGQNAIAFSGAVSKLEIVPRWWTL